ncbi:hypothetical protein AB1282_20130 [Gottfriedia sp. S16(2024)]|uniref:hypothetical protein n=1 Tax=Gottfriedia sp. S16(2024) TaxID=3162883 RepID=UPI003D1CC65F
MKSDEELQGMLKRKFVTAIYASTLFSIMFALIDPEPFDEPITSIQHYFSDVIGIIPIYLMYSLPFYLIYGVITSFLSETIANRFASRKKSLWLTICGIFHLLFGLILLLPGLLASSIYFLVDQWLKKRNSPFTTIQRIKLFATPIVVWLLTMSFVWLKG